MKSLLEAISMAVLAAVFLGVAFLFHGSPDLWDKMHAAAMAHFETKGAPTNGR